MSYSGKKGQQPEPTVYINDRIKSKQVRIIDDTGKQIGLMSIREAIAQAKKEELDLVQITIVDQIPVCRITDGGKYVFDYKKNMREQARRQREIQVDVKEIQLRPVTDSNDVAVKSRRTQEFLNEGDKVKVTVRFRGREATHKQEGHKIIAEFLGGLGEHRVEKPLTDTGRDMQMILAPIKSKAELLKDKKNIDQSNSG